VAIKKRPLSGWLSRKLDGYNVTGTAARILGATCSDEIKSWLCGERSGEEGGTIHSARTNKRQWKPEACFT
jgi:hypothetical protein